MMNRSKGNNNEKADWIRCKQNKRGSKSNAWRASSPDKISQRDHAVRVSAHDPPPLCLSARLRPYFRGHVGSHYIF